LIFLAEAVREAVFFEEPLGRPLLFPEAPGVAFNGKVGLDIFLKKFFFEYFEIVPFPSLNTSDSYSWYMLQFFFFLLPFPHINY